MSNGTPTANTPKRPALLALWIILGVVLVFILFVVGPQIPPIDPVLAWGIVALVSLLVLTVAGRQINGHWLGILIDTRNKYSLARLQISLWTIMVLSAFLAMALYRVRNTFGPGAPLNHEEALDIRFPEELLLAMGISAASFAGATLIKSNKTTRQITIEARTTPESAQKRRNDAQTALNTAEANLAGKVADQGTRKQSLDAAVQALAGAPADTAKQAARDQAQTMFEAAQVAVSEATAARDAARRALEQAEADAKAITEAQGLLHKNADPSEARWVDLFRGEEIGNYKLVDMAKVQMLFFTIAIVLAYGYAIATLVGAPDMPSKPELGFPDFNDTFNGLLGISHGTYLSVKAVNHS